MSESQTPGVQESQVLKIEGAERPGVGRGQPLHSQVAVT